MITEEAVQAYAEAYTLEELKAKRKEALEKLAALDAVTSATTGGGVSYTRTERIKAQELVELLQAAINRLAGSSLPAGQTSSVIFRNTYC